MLFQSHLKRAEQFFNTSLGFDLGTSALRVWQQKKEIISDTPHVVAIDRKARKVVGLGEEAREMQGKVPESILIVSPFTQGVMEHYTVSVGLYRHLFHEYLGKFFLLKPLVVASVASDATPAERQAVSQAMFSAGARQVYLIDSPLAAAIGAGIPVAQSNGNIIVHIGGGITEIAVISLGSIVHVKSIRIGGQDLDAAIAQAVRKQYNTLISLDVAREIKEKLLDLRRAQAKQELAIKGKDMLTGYPKELTVSAIEMLPSLEKPLRKITEAIHQFLEEIPAELASDVIDKGVIMTGGGAKLLGYDFCLSQVIGVPVSLAEEADHCVIKGVGLVLEHLDLYRQSLAFESVG